MDANYTYPNEWNPAPLRVRIPSWLNSVATISTPRNLDEERMKVILHQFFLSYIKNERLRRWLKDKNFLDGYFPVSSVLLKETCTNRYSEYVQALEDAGVIEKKRSKYGSACYLVGGFAQLFRWTPPVTFEGSVSFRADIVCGYRQVKSVLATRDRYAKRDKQMAAEYSKDNPVYEQLSAYLDDMEFDKGFTGEYEQQLVTDDIKFLMAEAYANKDLEWFSQDDFGFRLHHPIAALPKIYRDRLRFKDRPNEELAVLDIRNSQPYFSAVFMTKHLIMTYLPAFAPILPLIEKYERCVDFQLYRKLCIEGRLYEFIMERLGLKPKDEKERDKIRDDIKVRLFSSVLFSRLSVIGEKKRFRDYFRKDFPSVHAMFQTIKRMDETILPELKEIIRPAGVKFKYPHSNNAYKLVSALMQRAESAMMYQVVAPRLIEAGIKFVTVHDSVIILPENVELTKQIFRTSFEDVGLPAPEVSLVPKSKGG